MKKQASGAVSVSVVATVATCTRIIGSGLLSSTPVSAATSIRRHRRSPKVYLAKDPGLHPSPVPPVYFQAFALDLGSAAFFLGSRTVPSGPLYPPFHHSRSSSLQERRPSTNTAPTLNSRFSLESSLGPTPTVIAAIFLVAFASWTAVQLMAAPASPTRPDVSFTDTSMATNPPHTGHLGNLTEEQEEKLRLTWNAILKVCCVADSTAVPNGDATGSVSPRAPSAQEPESSQKRRFSLFRWKASENQEITVEANGAGLDDNDKYGQTKQYQKILANSTPESIRQTFWAMVKHDHPDALVLRFLRARKWDVDKALVMLVSAMSWRHTQIDVDGDIMKNGEVRATEDEKNGNAEVRKLASDFLAQFRMGKSFLHGTDKEGRPICIVRVRLHKPGAQSAESLERYTVFIIETARLMLEPPVETAVSGIGHSSLPLLTVAQNIIFDMTGFTLTNMDYHPVKFMIQCFEANYPESLGVVLVHNAPWVFQGRIAPVWTKAISWVANLHCLGIWRIIRGWLDPVVAAKVHFTNYRAGLEEFIAPSHIIKELGGDENWEYNYEEPGEDENKVMRDEETRNRLLGARTELYNEFEEATGEWTRATSTEQGKQARAKREEIAGKLRNDYWTLDPYLRSRSFYDRKGDILPGGCVNWYHKG